MSTIYIVTLTLLLSSVTDGFQPKKRYLAYNPADLSTALGYQNHQVHDLTSLVNEASGAAHATGNSKTQIGQAAYNVPNFPAMGQNQIQSQTGSLAGGSGNVVVNPIISGTNGGGSQVSGSSGSGSASFSGTNQWRCDAHVVETCDTQCLDVDPKDGCPFCIPGCHSSTGGSSSSGGQGTQSGSGIQNQGSLNVGTNQLQNSGPFAVGSGQISGTPTSTAAQSGNLGQNTGTLSGTANQSGNLGQNTGTLTGTAGQTGNLGQNTGTLTGTAGQTGNLGQNTGTLTGTAGQTGNLGQNTGTLTGTAGQTGTGLGGNLIQQPSGLAGTSGINQGTQAKQGTLGTTLTNSGITNVACPHFPPNCPKMYTAFDKNGCLECTILSRNSQTTKSPATTTTTTQLPVTSRTCAPTRCVAPCNIGIVLDASGCPHCRCPAHV